MNTYFKYKTDKRILPPFLKPYKKRYNKKFRGNWMNVINDFEKSAIAYQEYKKISPLLKQIQQHTILKNIRAFNKVETLKSINKNIISSFNYDYVIKYKSYVKPYNNTSSSSVVSTTSSLNSSIQDFIDSMEYEYMSQSPIEYYRVLRIYNVKSTSTTLAPSDVSKFNNMSFVLDDEDGDLEDILDLDLNGDDLDYEKITKTELPQYLYNNDNLMNDNQTINVINLDENEKIPTTTNWDTKTGRCVYDYLIYYYRNDEQLAPKLSYHKLFKYFNGQDLPNIKHIQISIWEEKHGKTFNDEVKLFWDDIIRIQEKYKNITLVEVDKLGKIKRNEYNKIFIKIPPCVEEVHNINISNDYFKEDNRCGIISKHDFLTLPDKRYKNYGEYYKDVWSVNIRNIKRFCKQYKIPMYCLSQDDRTIARHLPANSNGGHKSLAFKVVNGHIYGIENSHTIASLGVINSKKTSLISNNLKDKKKKGDEDDDEPPTKLKIIEVKTDKTHTQYLFDKMKELNIQVLNKNVCMKGNQILSFELDKVKYIFNNDMDVNYGKELLGEEEWAGEHIVQLSSQIFKDLYPNEEHKSILNNQVLEFLRLDGVKHRTHLGAIDNDQIDYIDKICNELIDKKQDFLEIIKTTIHKGNKQDDKPIEKSTFHNKYFDTWKKEKAIREGKTPIIEDWEEEEVVGKDIFKCYDINKCYSAILKSPSEDFMVLDFNSVFIPFEEDIHYKLPLGLYTIDTDDFTLFHGSNIYTKSIIRKGLDEKLITFDNIKMICIANKKNSLPKNHFHKLINEFKKQSNNNVQLFKTMTNLMTGILGKTESIHTKLNISSNFDEFSTYISSNKDSNPFCYIEGEEDNKIYMYGINDKRQLQENSLPIYLQILDDSNIKLYEMIKKCGGNMLYRKTDCILIMNPTKELLLDDDWGGYSIEKYPRLIHRNSHEDRMIKGNKMMEHIKTSCEGAWTKFNHIDSSEYKQILATLEDKKGLMMLGRAGTGKSFVIKNIDKIYKEQGKKVGKLAFTNIASLNIGGTTIHKFLKLNDKGDLLQSRINKIKEEIDLIIIDEISMVSSFLWRRLYHLHDLTQIPFLLVGDFRQIPPVEDMIYEDYREHPTIVNLSKNSYIELEKIHRYDDKLAEITKDLDGMMLIKKTDFKRKIGKVNICYLNKTRKKINTLLNTKLKPEKFVISKKLEWVNNDKKTAIENKALKIKYDEDNQTQDIYIYEGMPMISRLNCGDKLCNNEKFVVKSIDNDIITLTSKRPNDEGIEEEHTIEMDLDRIQLALLCCYCMTTHKSQGITIDGAVSIHDWDMMDKKLRYTAITRVKKYDNIYMV
tara:strand:+ start:5095 stop:9072 length:3978 start_codon:yes stop_codon:yes gene_type:complete